MLSRLISLLRRIPGVRWALTRLRPLPHGASIDVAPVAVVSAPVADVAPTLDPGIGAELLRHDMDIAVAVPAAEPDTAVSDIAESPSAAPVDIGIGEIAYAEPSIRIEPAACEETLVSPAAITNEPTEDAEHAASSDTPAETSTELAPAGAEVVGGADIEPAPLAVLEFVSNDEPSPKLDTDRVLTDDASVTRVEAGAPALEASEPDGDSAPRVALEIAPRPVIAVPVAQVRSAPKPRAKASLPVDRAALIRQRWAESGIRMWNPRLHGAGDATLNIQGRVELLPPAAGETMPRYDKLEFKMLGGQIVCEGVIVEAPAHASQRSFTRLAEPGKPDRAREPVRELQAALA